MNNQGFNCHYPKNIVFVSITYEDRKRHSCVIENYQQQIKPMRHSLSVIFLRIVLTFHIN